MADEFDYEMSREEEWRLVRELKPEEGRALMERMTRAYMEEHPHNVTSKALLRSEASADIAALRQRELDMHDRLLMRSAAESSRDTLHDNGPGKEPGVYTTGEARDRAAHAAPGQAAEPEK